MKQSTQNYLKTIFSLTLSEKKDRIKGSEISKRLHISAAAVTEMIKKLEADALVKNEPYKGVKLTPKGRKIGMNMLRHHRLWEAYLHQELGLPWDKVHDEAERLEHACSDTLINTIEEKLGFPQFDPHGNPIPDRNGNIPSIETDIPLSDCKIGQSYTIKRVVDVDKKFLHYIDEKGIRLGNTLTITDYLDFDQTFLCKVNNNAFSFSKQAASHIFVEEK